MRDKPDFVGHGKFTIDEVSAGNLPVNNLIVDTGKPEDAWIKETTQKIGDWRAYFQSTYIRWALAINGLHVAVERYESKTAEAIGFNVKSLRQTGLENIALWNMATAAKNHRETIPMMAAWGLLDLYSCLEEFIFGIYKIFLIHNPDSIMRGNEFSDLRRLRRIAHESEENHEKWVLALKERLDSWQRKRLYDGLSKVFLAYASVAGLKTPSSYKLSTIESWAETIKGIGELRNSFSHGAETVSQELAEFSLKPFSMQFDFKQGDPLVVDLMHLQSVECFLNQFLTALNLSLLERAGFAMPKNLR